MSGRALLSALRAGYLILFCGLAITLLLAVWPSGGTPSIIGSISLEMRYLLLAIAGGALGSSINLVARTLENIDTRSASPAYYSFEIRVLVSVPIVILSYLAVRGGLLNSSAPITCLNPFGLAGFSGLIGMFSPKILATLQNVAGALYVSGDSPSRAQFDRIEAALGISLLDNYDGYVSVSVAGFGSSLDEVTHLAPNCDYDLVVQFEPQVPTTGRYEQIRIAGGKDAPFVEFGLTPNGDEIRVSPTQHTARFAPFERSPEIRFAFRTPKQKYRGDILIEVNQKSRLVSVCSLPIKVMEQV